MNQKYIELVNHFIPSKSIPIKSIPIKSIPVPSPMFIRFF